MVTRRRTTCVPVVAITTVFLAGCAVSSDDISATNAAAEPPSSATSSPTITPDETQSSVSERANSLWDQIYGRNQAVAKTGSGIYQTPVRAMPQMRYTIDGEEPISIAEAYVAGQVVAVEPGRSFRWSYQDEMGDGPATKHELEFEAADAQASTIHLVMTIDRAIVDPDASEGVHQDLTAGSTATLGVVLAAPLDLDSIRSELVGQQTQLAGLVYDWEFFDYADNVWAVGNDGIQLGRIRDEVVEFPALRYEGGPEDVEGGSYTQPEGPNGPKIFTVPVDVLEAPQTGEPEEFTSDPDTGQLSPVT